MNANGFIYSAVVWAIIASLFGLGVGSWVAWRALHSKTQPAPVVGWLLLVMVALSGSQLVEQTRVLFFRLSYDSVIAAKIFEDLYNSVWSVVGGKLVLAVALMTGAALKLALYCNLSDKDVLHFAIFSAFGTLLCWAVLGYVLEIVL